MFYQYKTSNTQSGYTLIQLAIAIMVIGILFAGFANFYNQLKKEDIREETYKNVENAMDALGNFHPTMGRLPCPAPLTAQRSDPAYGEESDCSGAAIAALTPGQCASGICVEETVRTDLTGTDRRVIVGTLPFRTLQMEEEKAFDGYGSRLVYAVTLSATNDLTYNELKGAIAIRNRLGEPLTPIDGGALFLVLSSGPTKIGAYTKSGGLVSPCSGSGTDLENCNEGFATGTAPSTSSIYVSEAENDVPGPNFFDDLLSYFAKLTPPTWRRTTSEPENIQDMSGNFVGIGTESPETALEINSSGTLDSLRIYGEDGYDGKLMAGTVCDENGANCFDPLAIAGSTTDGDGMKCPTGQYMVGIENGGPKCASTVSVYCPDATPVLVGFDPSNGKPKCIAAPTISCAAETLTMCVGTATTVTVNLPDGVEGAHYPTSEDDYVGPAGEGPCRLEQYRCHGGNWVLNDSVGTCTQLPGEITGHFYYSQCDNFMGHAGDPDTIIGFGWNGDVYRDVVGQCGYTPAVTTYDVSACTCQEGDTRIRTKLACPAPYTGVEMATQTDTSTCQFSGFPNVAANLQPRPMLNATAYANVIPTTPRTHPGINAGPIDSSACTCPSTPGWEFSNCPTGFVRSSTPSPASFTSPSASWPSNTNRGSYRKKEVDASCNVTYSGWDSSNCVCDTTPSYSHTDTTCSNPVCEEPSSEPTTISGHPGAGTVEKGWDVFVTARDPMTSCSSSTTQIQTGTCTGRGFTWVNVGATGDTYTASTKPSREVGSSCSCDDHIETTSKDKACYMPADPSNKAYRCVCQ